MSGRCRDRLLFPVRSIPAREPDHASPGRRWKFRRNLVIYLANRHGCSQRLLADVFDLPHSRIAAIVKEFRARYGDGHGDDARPPGPGGRDTAGPGGPDA